MADQKIIDKIKALIAKAKGTSNEHEAEIFAAKARELLDKHQLSLNDLEDAADPVKHEYAAYEQRDSDYDWKKYLFLATAEYYGCRAAYGGLSRGGVDYDTIQLIGRESSIVTAQLMFPYLLKSVRKQARDTHERMGLSVNGAARAIGTALKFRLKDLTKKPEKTEVGKGKGLIKLSAMDALEEQKWGHYDEFTQRANKSNKVAVEAAAKIGLHRQTGQEGGQHQLENKS